MTEAELQAQVAEYLRMQYPNVLFHSDFGSGAKLTPAQAAKQKRQNGGRRAWPDLFIAEPSRDLTKLGVAYHGLFIELKKAGTRLINRNKEWATPHIAEQAEVLAELIERGYDADFACGFEEAKKLIDDYLRGVERK